MDTVVHSSQCEPSKLDAEVIILGNGPSALSLSVFLSGWLPYYDPSTEHPLPSVHEHLMNHIEESLIDQDFSWLEGIFDSYGVRALSLLYDSLARPDGDVTVKPLLRWKCDQQKAISHLLIAESPIGGSWNYYDNDVLAVSKNQLLDLPVFSISNWLNDVSLNERLPVKVVCKYFSAFAQAMDIDQNIHSDVKITHAWRSCIHSTNEEFWELRGLKFNQPITFRCKKLVLACGKTSYRTLGVEKLLDNAHLVNSVSELKQFVSRCGTANVNVVVVGDGISAADAVLFCLSQQISVLQVSRRQRIELKYLHIARLSPYSYPEYSLIYQLMAGRKLDRLYRILLESSVTDIIDDKIVIRTAHGIVVEQFTLLCVCAGRQSNLTIFTDEYEFDDYTCVTEKTLFRIGSSAEDNFIRYIVGGSLQVARYLLPSPLEMTKIIYCENSN